MDSLVVPFQKPAKSSDTEIVKVSLLIYSFAATLWGQELQPQLLNVAPLVDTSRPQGIMEPPPAQETDFVEKTLQKLDGPPPGPNLLPSPEVNAKAEPPTKPQEPAQAQSLPPAEPTPPTPEIAPKAPDAVIANDILAPPLPFEPNLEQAPQVVELPATTPRTTASDGSPTVVNSIPASNLSPPRKAENHPLASEVAVILANDQFFPRVVRLREGVPTRLIFTTINRKPAALIIERLQLQRWIAKDTQPGGNSESDRSKWEVNRELSSNKITEILWEPRHGKYQFHDALSGAKGEIQVE